VIETAADGMEAIAAVKARAPETILLDLMMPQMDGFGLLEQLNQDPVMKGIPVIVLTSRNLTDSDREVLKNRVASIIQKNGLESETLLSEIQAVLPTLG
jgi:CheY-like chemotaxis protein